MKELESMNSNKAKEEFAERFRMQQKHLDENYGDQRAKEVEMSNAFTNYAVLNFVLTLHDFSHLQGMDLLNAIQKMLLVHYGAFEAKVKIMEGALGSEVMKRLDIDTEKLYPTEYCTIALKEVQTAARARAKAGKYLKLEKPKKIIL